MERSDLHSVKMASAKGLGLHLVLLIFWISGTVIGSIPRHEYPHSHKSSK